MSLDLAERVLASPTLEPTCFGEAPLAVGAWSHIFPHVSNGPFEDDLACYRKSISWSPFPRPTWHGPFSQVGSLGKASSR